MSQPDSDSDKKINKGKSAQVARDFPKYNPHAEIDTNYWQDINWTPKKLLSIIFLLGIPYVGVILACFIAGISLIGYLLIGLVIFIGLLFLMLRSL
jgi:hypothetical protein